MPCLTVVVLAAARTACAAETRFAPLPVLGLTSATSLVIGILGIAVVALGVTVLLLLRAVRRGGRLEHKLKAKEQRLQSILDVTRHAAFFTTDVRGSDSRILDVSSGAIDMLGYSREEITGKPVDVLFDTYDATRMDRLHDTMARTGKPQSTEPAMVCGDGRRFPAILTTFPVIENGGQTVAAMSFVVDMTEHAQTEQKERHHLVQSRHVEKLRSLETLAGGVAHDFNNLLVGVLGNTELALLDMSHFSPARTSVEAIKVAAVQASELTWQLMAYAGDARFNMELAEINSIVKGVDRLLRSSVGSGVSMHYELADELPPIDADVVQIRQLLVSLVTNASDAIGDATGAITVSTGVRDATCEYLAESYLADELPAGKYVTLAVADTGAGVAPAVLSRLFDPFFSRTSSGRGLGLALVLGIVRGHKGTIRVTSQEGDGSCFAVLLPANESGAQEAWPGSAERAAEDDGAPQMVPATVLIIDDDENVRRVATSMLSRRGCEVLSAPSGPEGVETLKKRRDGVDIVILNMTMPDMNGTETFETLRNVKPDVDVVVCTGYAENQARKQFGDGDLAGIIQKPFEMKELVGLLAEILAKRQQTASDEPKGQP